MGVIICDNAQVSHGEMCGSGIVLTVPPPNHVFPLLKKIVQQLYSGVACPVLIVVSTKQGPLEIGNDESQCLREKMISV